VPILERLDHHYEIFRWEVPQLKMKPSDYFKRQCWISFDPDESLLKTTAEHLENLERELMAIHPYRVPEFVVIEDVSVAEGARLESGLTVNLQLATYFRGDGAHGS